MASWSPSVGDNVTLQVQDPRYSDPRLMWQVQDISAERVQVWCDSIDTAIKVKRAALTPRYSPILTERSALATYHDGGLNNEMATQSIDRFCF